jgi:hypothetical protein
MELFLARLFAVILGLVSLPITFALVIWVSLRAGARDLGAQMVVAFVISAAVLVFVVWKAPAMLERVLDRLRYRIPEPIFSCLTAGTTGALLLGSLMAIPILLLGHTRPEGWDLDSIPPYIAGAFLVGVILGIPMGLERRRDRERGQPPTPPSSQARPSV